MAVTYAPHHFIHGTRNVPITVDAKDRIDNRSKIASSTAGIAIWVRLMDASRDYANERSSKTYNAMIARGQVKANTLLLADFFGMSPWFWEVEAFEALKTPVGEYVGT